VDHTYNPSYLKGWNWKDCGSKSVWANSSWDRHLQNNQSKIDWRFNSSSRTPALQVWSLEFKPQSHQTTKKRSWTYSTIIGKTSHIPDQSTPVTWPPLFFYLLTPKRCIWRPLSLNTETKINWNPDKHCMREKEVSLGLGIRHNISHWPWKMGILHSNILKSKI
jgi:hypothetical protein